MPTVGINGIPAITTVRQRAERSGIPVSPGQPAPRPWPAGWAAPSTCRRCGTTRWCACSWKLPDRDDRPGSERDRQGAGGAAPVRSDGALASAEQASDLLDAISDVS